MNSSTKYIGMDVHKESISIAVRNAVGKIIMESVIETKASMILEFVEGLRGDVHVTLEEGTWSAWWYDLLKPRVTRLVVCDPRRNALLQEGNQNDRVDARKLAELLQNNQLRYQQLDALRSLRQGVRRELLLESKKNRAWKRLCQIPSIGPIRAAVLLGILQTPHRFRTKRQLWTYSGLGIEVHSSADHEAVKGQLRRKKKHVEIRGLNENCNHELKNLFKGAAVVASTKPGPFKEFYAALLVKGMRPEMARLTLARKVATIVLIIWKRGVCFDANHLKPQTA
jgi:transposase